MTSRVYVSCDPWSQRSFAEELKQRLTTSGFEASSTDIDGLQHTVIGKIDGALAVVVCLSSSYDTLEASRFELRRAIFAKIPIISILLDPEYDPKEQDWINITKTPVMDFTNPTDNQTNFDLLMDTLFRIRSGNEYPTGSDRRYLQTDTENNPEETAETCDVIEIDNPVKDNVTDILENSLSLQDNQNDEEAAENINEESSRTNLANEADEDMKKSTGHEKDIDTSENKENSCDEDDGNEDSTRDDEISKDQGKNEEISSDVTWNKDEERLVVGADTDEEKLSGCCKQRDYLVDSGDIEVRVASQASGHNIEDEDIKDDDIRDREGDTDTSAFLKDEETAGMTKEDEIESCTCNVANEDVNDEEITPVEKIATDEETEEKTESLENAENELQEISTEADNEEKDNEDLENFQITAEIHHEEPSHDEQDKTPGSCEQEKTHDETTQAEPENEESNQAEKEDFEELNEDIMGFIRTEQEQEHPAVKLKREAENKMGGDESSNDSERYANLTSWRNY